MKLIYRGVAYQYQPSPLRFRETGLVGKYRGADWRSRKLVDVPMQKPNFLKYRGIAYSTTQLLTPEFPRHNVCSQPSLEDCVARSC